MSLFEPDPAPAPAPVIESRTAHDLMWRAVANQWWQGIIHKPHHTRVGKIVRDLLLLDATPDSLQQAVFAHARIWPRATCTPESVVKHWAQLMASKSPSQARKAVDEGIEARRARDRACEETAEKARREAADLDKLEPARFESLKLAALEQAPALVRGVWADAERRLGGPGPGQRMAMVAILKRGPHGSAQ